MFCDTLLVVYGAFLSICYLFIRFDSEKLYAYCGMCFDYCGSCVGLINMCLYRIGENEVVTSHGASSDKIITVETINSRSRFRLNYVSFNTSFISAVRINCVVYEEATSYSPLYSAIKNEFIMLARRNVNNTVTISTLHNDGSDWN